MLVTLAVAPGALLHRNEATYAAHAPEGRDDVVGVGVDASEVGRGDVEHQGRRQKLAIADSAPLPGAWRLRPT